MERVKIHIIEYSAFLKWLIADLYNNCRWHLIFIIATVYIGLSLQSASVYIAYYYSKAIELNTEIEWNNFVILPRESILFLTLLALSVLIMLILSGILVMKGRIGAIKLSRIYTDLCSKRIYVLSSYMNLISNKFQFEQEINQGLITRLATRDAQTCGIMIRILSNSLLPLGTVFVAGIALLMIDFWLTAIVFVILLMASVYLYKTSIEGASYRLLMERHTSGMSKEKRGLVKRIIHNPVGLDYSDSGMNEIFNSGVTASFTEAFIGQRQVMEKSNLIAQIVTGVSIFMIFLIQGSATLRNESNWSALLIYLVAFGFFATNFSKAVRTLTSINRFYPAINRYSRFVSNKKINTNCNANVNIERYIIPSKCFSLNNQPMDVTLGEKIILIIPDDFSVFSLTPAIDSFKAQSSSEIIPAYNDIWFISSQINLSGVSLRQAFGFDDNYTFKQLKEDIKHYGLAITEPDIPKSWDSPLTKKQAGSLSLQLSFFMLVISGFKSNKKIFIFDQNYFDEIDHVLLNNLFKILKDKVVIIAYDVNKIDSIDTDNVTKVIFGGIDKLTGWCDYLSFKNPDTTIKAMKDQLFSDHNKLKKKDKFIEMLEDEEMMM